MSQAIIKKAIAEKKMLCPTCQKPILQYEKMVDMTDSVWDGAGDSNLETSGVKVTLICANPPCDWRERTEYWNNYIVD